MELNFYHVTAFADQPFKGNPAAVIILEKRLDESLMQNIAAEFNLSETVFCVPEESDADTPRFTIRWFTPEVEIPLCGHATVAATHVLHHHTKTVGAEVIYASASGELGCKVEAGVYTLDFPANVPLPVATPNNLEDILGCEIIECLEAANKYLVLVENEQSVANIRPNFNHLLELEARGFIVSAPADAPELDFVSRFFAPAAGINEDPVTGSAHTVLAPYYAARLQKQKLKARQISKRGGNLRLELVGNRVHIGGEAHTVMQGQLYV